MRALFGAAACVTVVSMGLGLRGDIDTGIALIRLLTLWEGRPDALIESMIVGTGIDLVEIDRIQHSMDRYGARFLNRVYTTAELAYCLRKRNAAESLAARFAAKEAGAKALGTGMSYGVTWREIEVVREPGGRPTIRFHGRAAEMSRKLNTQRVALSLTHTADMAMASVILEDPL